MMRSLFAAVVLVAGVGCSDPTGVPDAEFRITAVETGLEMTNHSGVDLFYQAVDPETLALWAGPTAVTACLEPDCPHVAPGATVTVPWDQVLGWRAEATHVEVYWWRVVSDGQGGWRMATEGLRSRDVAIP